MEFYGCGELSIDHRVGYPQVGRWAEALGAYRTVQRPLADELGIDPSPELAVLHRAVLGGDSGGVDCYSTWRRPRSPSRQSAPPCPSPVPPAARP